MSEPRDYTFGDEGEEQTRTRQERDVRSMTRSTFGTEPSELKDEKRLDPREFLAEARRSFFESAQKTGLNAHEALHSWVDGVEVEESAGTNVTAMDYCKFKIAERLGITVEELDRQRDKQREILAQRLGEILRPRLGDRKDLN